MHPITIYHNPRCGTSRNTLALLRERGFEPEVIEYLHTPPSRETLRALIAATGQPTLALVRTKEALFTELGLDAPGVTDAQLVDAMLAHPAGRAPVPPSRAGAGTPARAGLRPAPTNA